ncbi:MAG: hypothetical protein ACRCXT_02295, partial [Paraclostridium sp.]
MAFNYEIEEGLDCVFDEKGNTFLAMRKVRWSENGEFKLDLRKYYINSDGEEVVGKGLSFMTEEGPHELTKSLIDNGYGHTQDIIEGVMNRPDFEQCLEYAKDGVRPEDNNDIYFDPKGIL